MPITVNWLYPQRVVLIECSGVLTLDDFDHLITAIAPFEQQAAGALHRVIDLSSLERDFDNFFQLQRRLRSPRVRGTHIIVGANTFAKYIGTAVATLWRLDLYFLGGRDSAVTFLLDTDPTLTPDGFAAPDESSPRAASSLAEKP